MTWHAIRGRLRKRWTLDRDEATWCCLVVTLGGNRTLVVIKPTIDLTPQRLMIAAQVCPLHAMDPAVALRYNASAPRGALALEQQTYLLRELVAFDAPELEAEIEALAAAATRIREGLQQAATRTSALAYYAD